MTTLLIVALVAGVLSHSYGPGLCDVKSFRAAINGTAMGDRLIRPSPGGPPVLWNIITPNYFQSPLPITVRITSNPTNQSFLGFLIHTGYSQFYQEGYTPGQFILDPRSPLTNVSGRPQNAGCQSACLNCFGTWGHTVAASPLFRTPFELPWYPLLASSTVKFYVAILVGTLHQPSTQEFLLLESAEVASGLSLPPPPASVPFTPPNIVIQRHSVTLDMLSKVCDTHGYEEVQFQCSGCSNLESWFVFPFFLNRDADHTHSPGGQRLTALSSTEGLIVLNYTVPPRMVVWLNWTIAGRTPRYLRYNITYESAVMTTTSTLSDTTSLRFSLWGRSVIPLLFAEWSIRLRNVGLSPSSTEYKMSWDRPASSGGPAVFTGTGSLRPWLEITYPGNDSMVYCVVPDLTDSSGTVPSRVPGNGTDDFFLTITLHPAWEPWEFCQLTTTDKYDAIQGDGDVIAALAVGLVLMTVAIAVMAVRCVLSYRKDRA